MPAANTPPPGVIVFMIGFFVECIVAMILLTRD